MGDNILLYSKKTNEMEHFDPTGARYDPLLDVKLKQYFEGVIPNVKYISTKDYMTTIGFQKLDLADYQKYIGDPLGYCIAWSIWYVDMRMSYSNISRVKLIKYIMQQIMEKKQQYKAVIRNYSKNITDVRDKILLNAGMDINQYLNGEYDEQSFTMVVNQINSELMK